VVLHVDAVSDDASVARHISPSGTDRPTPARGGIDGGVLELAHDAHGVSAETSRRVACDAAVVQMRHDANGDVLDAGRRTRTVPPSIRRALSARDRTCRFPGCASRRCDAHHIDHWADGGASSLDNLVLLCRRHHRAVHEGGFRVGAGEGHGLAFWRPDGERIDVVSPPIQNVVLPPVGMDPSPAWDGTRFDVAWAIDVLWRDPR
jgi:5-methylcytosine-specific restriction endonuclease McrA